jgi:hypothetical protein
VVQLDPASSIRSVSCRRGWPQSRPVSSSHISDILRKIVLLPRSGRASFDGLVHGPPPPRGSRLRPAKNDSPLNDLRFLSNFANTAIPRPKRSRCLGMRSRTRLGDRRRDVIYGIVPVDDPIRKGRKLSLHCANRRIAKLLRYSNLIFSMRSKASPSSEHPKVLQWSNQQVSCRRLRWQESLQRVTIRLANCQRLASNSRAPIQQ